MVQIIGVGVFGYLIGNVVSILSKKDSVMSTYIENVELLTNTLNRRDLPPRLQKRILSYYSYLREEKMGYDESAFLDSLPDSLKDESSFNLKRDFIEEIHLFKNASEKFTHRLLPLVMSKFRNRLLESESCVPIAQICAHHV